MGTTLGLAEVRPFSTAALEKTWSALVEWYLREP
jgi:hypothetical protein